VKRDHRDPILPERLRELVDQLVRDGHFSHPPICPYSLAARNGILVREEFLVESREPYAVAAPPPNRWLLTLHSGDPYPLRCWKLALAMLKLLTSSRRRAHYTLTHWERAALLLLMPTRFFDPLAAFHRFDLPTLHQHFPNVPPERLGERVLLLTPAILTVIEQGQVARRIATEGLRFTPQPTDQEWEALWAALDKGRSLVSEGSEATVRVWVQEDQALLLTFPKRTFLAKE
jgi:hypothetical protein